MVDRKDPVAPWFSLEKLASGEALKESRVANPPAMESAQMKPRQDSIIIVPYTSGSFHPLDDTQLYSFRDAGVGGGDYIRLGCAAACSGVFRASLPALPIGSSIYTLKMRSYRLNTSGAITFNVVEQGDDGSSTSRASLLSTANGAFATDNAGIISPIPVIAEGKHYFVEVILQSAAGYVANDLKFTWAEVHVQTPGEQIYQK